MPARDRLLDDVLDRRLVDDRQHLLRLAFVAGQEARAEPGGGDDRLLDHLLHVAAHAQDATRQLAARSSPTSGGSSRSVAGIETELLALHQPAQVRQMARDHEQRQHRDHR